MEYEYKEVYYHEYCEKCKYFNIKETEDPCNECIGEPINLHSHKPVNFVANKKKVLKGE